MFLEIEAEPAGGEAALAVRLFTRDQCGELERLGDRHPADLSRGHLGEHEVVVFQRPLEDGSRMALRGRRNSSPGPRRPRSVRREGSSRRARARAPGSLGYPTPLGRPRRDAVAPTQADCRQSEQRALARRTGAVSAAEPTAPTRYERWPSQLPHPNVRARSDLRWKRPR